MQASIVLGTQFGDEGKGMVTNSLCENTYNPIVIRFNGGQQAGHTVQIDNVRHVHSNYGSGTLRGVPSYFSEHTSIYLPTINKERKILEGKGVKPKLFVHPLTMLTTPFDVAWNRMTESTKKHGSCGLGIAATAKRNWETPYKLYAIDLLNKSMFSQKLQSISDYYNSILTKLKKSSYTKWIMSQVEPWKESLEVDLFEIRDYSLLEGYDELIFEGAQGILLDMNHGIYPNVTCSNTTSKNALEICQKMDVYPDIYYVSRCYQTRHGNGWMSNESNIPLINNTEETNVQNKWQGNFRIGELDYDLVNHAMAIDNIYSMSLRKNLVITCLDQRPDFYLQEKRFKNIDNLFKSYSPCTLQF